MRRRVFVLLGLLGVSHLVSAEAAGLNLLDLLKGDLKQQDDLRTNQFAHAQLTPAGTKDWSVTARSATVFRRSAHDRGLLAQAERLTFSAYTGANEVFQLQTDSGQVDLGRNLMLRGHVIISFRAEGYSLRTHSLRYTVRTKKFTTPDKVTLVGPDKRWEGIGLIVRPFDGRIQLASDAVVYGKNGRPELRAASLQVDLPGNEGLTSALARFVKMYDQFVQGGTSPVVPGVKFPVGSAGRN